MTPINKKEITGIILSGGESSRLGEDKGLYDFKGKALISYAIETLKPFCNQIVVSANNFHEKYRAFQLPVIADEIKGIGPMGGILTCLKHSTTQHNIVISCDTPFVNTAMFEYLLKEIENYQVVAPAHETFLIEPLNAYYNTNTIGDMERTAKKENYKMLDFFKTIRFKSVQINEKLPFFNDRLFLNLNTGKDMNRARPLFP